MGSFFFQCEQYIEGALHTVSQSPKMWLNSSGLRFWETSQHTGSDATPCTMEQRPRPGMDGPWEAAKLYVSL